MSQDPQTGAPHIPVLIRPLIAAVAPVSGTWLDGTFGAGGYTRELLAAGADKVIGVDRDPLAHEMAQKWIGEYNGRIELVRGTFSRLDEYAQDLDGVVLDLGVSSMQLDLAERGFSFMREGPLDMRMSQDGPSAADLVNEATEAQLADIIYLFGEERASRRIAKSIVKARTLAPITTTLRLAEIVEGCLPRAKPGQAHPATRTFQGLRIAVNDEYEELLGGLIAAEKALKPGGKLAVVTFHSIEDRIVKRFLTLASGGGGRANRYAPETEQPKERFKLTPRKAIAPDSEELAINPRSRSAKLRVAVRTEVPAGDVDAEALGLPRLKRNG
ncbi:16S rRNA (cytosine(1402)-N(4))-methyltransferase RsmH [Donghicola sp. C2-DW-16]|uniref:Ribosomal RNA small subunit methyltransferase H n=1 Tax=Donghicola mangrovi TaxID=2729614 RepID=A0ABX2PHW4_9RHOB|nr:16S rRNA (cytosine(1402)-N(4))-methyltransferase RsmH [Donghicola mangrovi]NVO29098.1 16S rRNA (cytosine(1402)-N(4))-methyltransferase RsmH [Donghicola mangrovi]